MLLYGEWVEESVLEAVPHRQYVFTLPRLPRPIFAQRRAWLGVLCRIVARLLRQAYAASLPRRPTGTDTVRADLRRLGELFIRTCMLAADGAFFQSETFVPLPSIPEELLARGFRKAVLDFPAAERAITEDLRPRLLASRRCT